MLDIHSHILPQIDDGSKNIEESLSMLKLLKEQHVSVVAATPHFYAWENEPERFFRHRQRAYEALKAELDDDAPKILLGAEVHYFPGISKADVIPRFMIQNTRLLLLEMPFAKWTDSMIRELIDMSDGTEYTLLLAHIERYLSFTDMKTLQLLIDRGVLVQANAHFFHGFSTKRKALSMLQNGQIHLIGTDCHNTASRAPDMHIFEQAVTAKFGADYFRRFVRSCESYVEGLA